MQIYTNYTSNAYCPSRTRAVDGLVSGVAFRDACMALSSLYVVGVLTGTRKDKPRRNCLASQISIVIAFLHPVLCFGYVSFWIRFVLDMFWFWLVLVLARVGYLYFLF